MKIMVSFELTEDYIIEADNESDALKEVQKIFDFKQTSQNDLSMQSNIEYHSDIRKKYKSIEGTNE